MKKQTLRVAILAAALSAVSFTGFVRAADEPAKPADSTTPAKPATPPANQPGGRGNFNPADMLKNYRDQFEGVNLTDDQMKKIDGFIEAATTEVNKAGDDRRAAFQALGKLREDVQSVLTEEQKTAMRTKRINTMFDDMKKRYTGDELKLTDDQKSKINTIIDEAKKTALAAPPAPAGRRQWWRPSRWVRRVPGDARHARQDQ